MSLSTALPGPLHRARSLFLSLCMGSLVLTLPPTALAAPPTSVFVQRVESDTFVQSMEALGTLRANDSVTLSATVTDTVTEVRFTDGQRVAAGDVLVEMNSAEEQAQLVEAQSELHEAERQFERVRSLAERDLANQSDLDQRRRAFEIAQARLQVAQSRLQDRQIVAPFDGVVGLRNLSVGALLRPGDTVTTLDDDSVMKLDMNVPSLYLDVLRPGLSVTAQARALNNRSFEGTINSISSRVDPVSRSAVVRALIPNPDRLLRPGLLMTVQLQRPPRQVLTVAEEAVVQQGRRAWVYVVDTETSPATAIQRDVTLGARQPGIVEVTQGLREGEQVVIHGTMKLRNGSPVEIAARAEGDETLQELLNQAAESAARN